MKMSKEKEARIRKDVEDPNPPDPLEMDFSKMSPERIGEMLLACKIRENLEQRDEDGPEP